MSDILEARDDNFKEIVIKRDIFQLETWSKSRRF